MEMDDSIINELLKWGKGSSTSIDPVMTDFRSKESVGDDTEVAVYYPQRNIKRKWRMESVQKDEEREDMLICQTILRKN